MDLYFSIIVPVYNRPDEIDELLKSLTEQDFQNNFEVLIIEDGSTHTSKAIIEKYKVSLKITYYYKENTGAGSSRNFGMARASGNYFIILDSDVIVPPDYLSEVHKGLTNTFTDAFGGPDAAHESFSPLQKAINFSMTSTLTTGGIRGKQKSVGKFQLRSFNLGMSQKAYKTTQGFSAMKVGEDIDLTFRLWQNKFETQLLTKAFVYHKRRSTIKQFLKQTFAFGTARPVLNKKYPKTAKLTFWLPSIFLIGFFLSILLGVLGCFYLLYMYMFYLLAIFFSSLLLNKSIKIAVLSVVTTCVQFFGYGSGFLKSLLITRS